MAYLDENGLRYLWLKILALVSDLGGGDMLKSIYDTNGNGIVDNAEKVNGKTVAVNVPSDAKFTDTTYSNATSSAAGLMSGTDKSKLDALPTAASLESTYAKKTDITGVYKYKGSVAAVSNLPSTGNTTGDVYNVEARGINYAWNGSAWDALGELFEVPAIPNATIDSIVGS